MLNYSILWISLLVVELCTHSDALPGGQQQQNHTANYHGYLQKHAKDKDEHFDKR